MIGVGPEIIVLVERDLLLDCLAGIGAPTRVSSPFGEDSLEAAVVRRSACPTDIRRREVEDVPVDQDVLRLPTALAVVRLFPNVGSTTRLQVHASRIVERARPRARVGG